MEKTSWVGVFMMLGGISMIFMGVRSGRATAEVETAPRRSAGKGVTIVASDHAPDGDEPETQSSAVPAPVRPKTLASALSALPPKGTPSAAPSNEPPPAPSTPAPAASTKKMRDDKPWGDGPSKGLMSDDKPYN